MILPLLMQMNKDGIDLRMLQMLLISKREAWDDNGKCYIVKSQAEYKVCHYLEEKVFSFDL